MKVEERVDQILSRKTFATDSLRARTREALLKTLRPVEAIKSYDDESYELTETRYDSSDGVKCTTIDALEQAQKEKKNDLSQRAREFFSADEQEEVDTGGVATALDVNRKLKWGYTLLHFAALSGDEAECDRLVAAGADKTLADNGGKLPWEKAVLKGHDALAVKLRS